MDTLYQIIYSSVAEDNFLKMKLSDLLKTARRKNKELNITGILLYHEGNFIQVIEGEQKKLDSLFERIKSDRRHRNITQIIREPISRRSFSEWSMGLADISPEEIVKVPGLNDFLTTGHSFETLTPGRAKKILTAFLSGRWRTKIRSSQEIPEDYSFAFQPIVDIESGSIFSYEALIRGSKNEPAGNVLSGVDHGQIYKFDLECRLKAVKTAGQLKISTHLNLNVLPGSLISDPDQIIPFSAQIQEYGISPQMIILEILESEIIDNMEDLISSVNKFKREGFLFAIDDFGAGHAGLNLLVEFQPDLLKLDMMLIRNIHESGPRQAVIHGIMRTCTDLGIDIIAEGVESHEEYSWLKDQGIHLYQGYLFGRPEFEKIDLPLKTV